MRKKFKPYIGYLFIFLAIILLFVNYTDSISVTKFLFEKKIDNLLHNYHLFKNDLSVFFIKTIPFHEGDSSSGWNSFFYLLPLFIFLSFVGGLSLLNLHLFTAITFVFSLFLFHYLLRKYWGNMAANIGTCFFALSSVFQEIARTANYHGSTVLIALILIIFIFRNLYNSNGKRTFFLGIITGLSWYFYGPVRFIFPVTIGVVCKKKGAVYKNLSLFFSGIITICSFGVVLTLLNNGRFIDEEHLLSKFGQTLFYIDWFCNIKAFWIGLIGGFHDAKSSLVHNILLIPLIIGAIHITKNLKYKVNKFFLILILSICVLPVFITVSHTQLRRYILYLIPLYMLIGIGGSRIVEYCKAIKSKSLKKVFLFSLIALSIFVIFSEILLVSNNIWKDSPLRDTGILKFGRKVGDYSCNNSIFYLQEFPHKLYEGKCEGNLLTLILKNTDCDRKVESMTNLTSITLTSASDGAYIIKSPFISKESFVKKCNEKNWIVELILSGDYKGPLNAIDKFRFYFVKKRKKNS